MKVKIYYHDTDCGGVVYYSNYLKFLEEARTDFFESRGLFLKKLAEDNIMFVVARQEMDYKLPAHYADILEISTKVCATSNVKIDFEHEVKNQENKLICKGRTLLVCVGADLRPRAMPDEIKKGINEGVTQ